MNGARDIKKKGPHEWGGENKGECNGKDGHRETTAEMRRGVHKIKE